LVSSLSTFSASNGVTGDSGAFSKASTDPASLIKTCVDKQSPAALGALMSDLNANAAVGAGGKVSVKTRYATSVDTSCVVAKESGMSSSACSSSTPLPGKSFVVYFFQYT
jgi:hypothetical protein